MENIVHLLPDSVANQIAAGEVIQRPASVVKELVENSIDAGATQIDIVLKDAGRNLIRVTDNGKGMSPHDARLAFERHATSKIQTANDLFYLRTMGFRGEALASIASIAQVELVTRRQSDELAWKIEIEGSEVTNEELTLAALGSRFSVKNLFYNVPARRKFLGDNAKELKAIRDAFIQIALVYPDIQFSLIHNEETLYLLPPSNSMQRILGVFGKRNGGQLQKQLYPVDVQTQLIRITGYVGDPAAACQRDYMQYFFVNNRFVKHKVFRSAVLKAYEMLVPQGQQPAYFLYFEVDPQSLDVNIHPTKTEVKFEHEQALWPIIHATVRGALGKANAVPSIDFDRDDAPDIRVFTGDRQVVSPSVRFDPGYNPFNSSGSQPNRVQPNWDSLLQGFEKKASDLHSGSDYAFPTCSDSLEAKQEDFKLNLPIPVEDVPNAKFQLFHEYIVAQTSTSMILVDQHRAHFRLLFESYLDLRSQHKVPSQTLLFAEPLELDPVQQVCLSAIIDELTEFGFGIDNRASEFFLISVPMDVKTSEAGVFLLNLLDSLSEAGTCPVEEQRRTLAATLAESTAIPRGKKLSDEEMADLLEKLFSLNEHSFAPDGKRIWVEFSLDEVRKRF
jgi:DNA mismatch repair protein MutL